MNTTTTGAMIRAARKEAGMTQSQLAATIGVSQALISYYESDTEAPVSALSEIAQATGHELVVRFEKKCEKKRRNRNPARNTRV